MNHPLSLIGAGVCSSLGPSLALHGAATAAGMDRFSTHPWVRDAAGEPVVLAQARFLPADLDAGDRLAALGEQAVRDCLAQLARCPPTRKPIASLLFLPRERAGFDRADRERVRQRLSALLPGPVLGLSVPGFQSFFAGLEELRRRFESGECDYAIVGAADCKVDEPTLRELLNADRLFCAEQPWAAIPGEAACFLLFARQPLPGAVQIWAQGYTKRAGDEPTGNALGELFTQLGQGLPAGRNFRAVHYGHAGGRGIAEEFEVACIKAAGRFDLEAERFKPLDQWGDVGRAWLPLLLAYAFYRRNSGDLAGQDLLLWAADAGDERAAFWVEV